MNATSQRDWGSVVMGVAMIIIGFAFLLVPGITLVAVAAIAGIALLASGVVDVVSYARYRKELDLSGWMLASALLDIALGAVVVLHPLASAIVVPWVAASAFAVYGVLEIVAAWRLSQVPTTAAAAFSNDARGRNGEGAAGGSDGANTTAGTDLAGDPSMVQIAPSGTWGWSLFAGVMAIACAVAFFMVPESFALFLAFFVMVRGIVAIAHGVSVGRAAAQHYAT